MGIFRSKFTIHNSWRGTKRSLSLFCEIASLLSQRIVNCVRRGGCIILLISSCTCHRENPINHTPPIKASQVPSFNEDSAYAFVKAQVDFGPRVPNTKEHDAC